MTNKDRLFKLIESIQDKLADGWDVEIITVNNFTSDEDNPSLAIELVLEKK